MAAPAVSKDYHRDTTDTVVWKMACKSLQIILLTLQFIRLFTTAFDMFQISLL